MKKIFFQILFVILWVSSVKACDDTLIMMLTDKNPGSEFSKVMRKFSSNLSDLGLALNQHKTNEIPQKLNKVMAAWLDFSKNYSFNPPPEAKNDTKWVEKIKKTSRTIGRIRVLIQQQKIMQAHDLVLDLSSKMGMFFEGFGISKEKQMFIDASAAVTRLERFFHSKNVAKMKENLDILKNCLTEFEKYLPEEGKEAKQRANELINAINSAIQQKQNLSNQKLQNLIDKTSKVFKELRSYILMNEWFAKPKNTDKKADQ